MCLKECLPDPHMKLTVCELDGEMESVAERYFCFQKVDGMRVVVGDGVEYMRQLSKSAEGR